MTIKKIITYTSDGTDLVGKTVLLTNKFEPRI